MADNQPKVEEDDIQAYFSRWLGMFLHFFFMQPYYS